MIKYLQNTINTGTALMFILLLAICSALTAGKQKRIKKQHLDQIVR